MENENLEQEEQVEGLDYVACRLCDMKCKVITAMHLKKVHNTNMAEYREVFPDAQIGIPFSRRRKHDKQNDIVDDQSVNQEIVVETLPEDKIIEPIISPVEDNKELPSKPEYPKVLLESFDSVFKFLKSKFKNIQTGILSKSSAAGDVEYYFQVDFFDKSSKTVFEFPNTLWHNPDRAYEHNKLKILKKHGWVIYVVNEKHPSTDSITNMIDNPIT